MASSMSKKSEYTPMTQRQPEEGEEEEDVEVVPAEIDAHRHPLEIAQRLPVKRRRPRCSASYVGSCRWCTRRVALYTTIAAAVLGATAFAYLAVVFYTYRHLCPLIKDVMISLLVLGPVLMALFSLDLWRTSRGVLKSYCLCTRIPSNWKKLAKQEPERDLEIEQDMAVRGDRDYETMRDSNLPESTWKQRCNACNLRQMSWTQRLLWFVRVVLIAVVTVSTLALIVVAIVLGVLRNRTLPDLQSDQTLRGLHEPVKVNHESNGLYHIHAQNAEDVAFAQGFVHSQFRLFQMELQRRIGKGTVSEIAGDGGLEIDKLVRTLGMEKAARRAWETLQNDDSENDVSRRMLIAYAAGVNAFIDKGKGMPLEFWLLGYTPEHWKPEDSLIWGKMMNYDLGKNMAEELSRFRLNYLLGVSRDRVATLMPPYNLTKGPTVLNDEDLSESQKLSNRSDESNDHLLNQVREILDRVPKHAKSDSLRTAESKRVTLCNRFTTVVQKLVNEIVFTGAYRNFLASPSQSSLSGLRKMPNMGFGASNNWVIHGNLTSSGYPILCNDPHLQFMAPSIWILNSIHIHNATYSRNITGASFPGIPGVVLGHNDEIAWGVTNSGADVQDLYVMDAVNFTHYMMNGSLETFDIHEEVIKVNNGKDRVIKVRTSRFGPVVTDNNVVDDIDTPLSLKWTAIDPDVPDTTVKAFMLTNFAHSFEDFQNAMMFFTGPSQNFVYADKGGNIAYQLSGQIPIRSDSHKGAWPVPGNGSFETLWNGYIPFEELPTTKNPRRGFVVSANNQIVPPSYRYHLSSDYSSMLGYRAARITDMIRTSVEIEREQITLERMKSIQLDYRSYQARDVVEQIVSKVSSSKLDDETNELKDALTKWNFDEPVGDRMTPIFASLLRELYRLGSYEANSTYYRNAGYLLSALSGGTDPACTNYRFGGELLDSCEEFVVISLKNVSKHSKNRVTSSSGATPSFVDEARRWGHDTHRATFISNSLGDTPLGCMANRKTSHGGDFSTVNVGPFDLEDDQFPQTHGPSYRTIMDLATIGSKVAEEQQRSLFINPMGQSGRIFSENYDSMLEDWSEGKYYPMILQNSKNSDSDFNQNLKP